VRELVSVVIFWSDAQFDTLQSVIIQSHTWNVLKTFLLSPN